MPPSNPCGLVIHGHRGAGAGRDIVSLAAALENRRHLAKKRRNAAFELSTATGFRGAGACRQRERYPARLPLHGDRFFVYSITIVSS